MIRILKLSFIFISLSLVLSSLAEDIAEPKRSDYPEVVEIFHRSDNKSSNGSGFFIKSGLLDSYFLVTNFHVVYPDAAVFFKDPRTGHIVSAEDLYAVSLREDIAVFKLRYYKPEFFYDLKESERKKVKSEFSVLGFPGGKFLSLPIQTSIVFEPRYGLMAEKMDHWDLNMNGISGGAVISKNNQLMGLIYSSSTNYTYFTPVEKLKELMSNNPYVVCSRLCIEKELKSFIHEATTQRDPKDLKLLADIYRESRYNTDNEKESRKLYAELFSLSYQMLNLQLLYKFDANHVLMKAYPGEKQIILHDLRINTEDLERLSNQGHPPSQHVLALVYQIRDRNHEQAMYWLNLSAEQGYKPALNLLHLIDILKEKAILNERQFLALLKREVAQENVESMNLFRFLKGARLFRLNSSLKNRCQVFFENFRTGLSDRGFLQNP